MRYRSLALVAVAVAFVSAYPNKLAKREDYVHDKDGNLRLTCKSDCAIADSVEETKISNPPISL